MPKIFLGMWCFNCLEEGGDFYDKRKGAFNRKYGAC